jgi:hypothetical protein
VTDFPVCLEGERLVFMATHISRTTLPGGVRVELADAAERLRQGVLF